ncbi:hypothetical protein FLONG3_7881 [Fusarium longipes]|uniref:Uncharacterized protein n=1 Tax=Fusarium longipes TaxID=694270 RepID=A0A395SAI4_9HYPO|nr:hypothetical protein FLONG3_7881 [Fusarium longipes]
MWCEAISQGISRQSLNQPDANRHGAASSHNLSSESQTVSLIIANDNTTAVTAADPDFPTLESVRSTERHSEEGGEYIEVEEKAACIERLKHERQNLYDLRTEYDTDQVTIDIDAANAAVHLAKEHVSTCTAIRTAKLKALRLMKKQAKALQPHVPPEFDVVIEQMVTAVAKARQDESDAKDRLTEKTTERQNAIDEKEWHKRYDAHVREKIKESEARVSEEESALDMFDIVERLGKAGFKGLRRASSQELKTWCTWLKAFDIKQ